MTQLLRVLRAPTLWIIVAIVIAGLILIRWIASLGGAEAFAERFGSVAALVTVPVHVIIAVTPFPSDPIAIANGSLYGWLYGACLNWIGWGIAAVVEFQLGRRAREDFNLEQQVSQLPSWLQRLPVDHPVFLIGARQIPWLGGHVTTFLPGAAAVRWKRFLWCAAVGIVPSSILMAAIGAGLVQIMT